MSSRRSFSRWIHGPMGGSTPSFGYRRSSWVPGLPLCRSSPEDQCFGEEGGIRLAFAKRKANCISGAPSAAFGRLSSKADQSAGAFIRRAHRPAKEGSNPSLRASSLILSAGVAAQLVFTGGPGRTEREGSVWAFAQTEGELSFWRTSGAQPRVRIPPGALQAIQGTWRCSRGRVKNSWRRGRDSNPR